jgi:hypothetical protein
VDRKFVDRKIINELDQILMFISLMGSFLSLLKVFSVILPHRSKVLVGASALATKSGAVFSRSRGELFVAERGNVIVINQSI